jgi:hypothetical protein
VSCAIEAATERGDRGRKTGSTSEPAALRAGVAGGSGRVLVLTSRLLRWAKGRQATDRGGTASGSWQPFLGLFMVQHQA